MILLLTLSSALAADPQVDPSVLQQALTETGAARAKRALPSPTITENQYRKAADGHSVTGLERVEGSGARRAWGIAVIDAPIGKVWSAVNDFASHPELTKVAYSELQTGGRCTPGRTVFQYLPVGVPMVADRWWVTTLSPTPAVAAASGGKVRELTAIADVRPEAIRTTGAKAMSDKGTPIAFSRGGWFLVQLDEQHTLAEFTVWSDPGGYIPASVASSFATGGVADNLEALKKLVQLGPGCPEE